MSPSGSDPRFIATPRRPLQRRPVAERLTDWRDLDVPRPEDQAAAQGGRCIGCGVPFCHQGCPLGNRIPDWNALIHAERWEKAYRRLAATNNFPEFTGRICPAPCEPACTLAIHLDAVTIELNEKDIIERAFAEGWVKAQPPSQRSGRQVAVVGSGPAGLAAAAQLNAAGHRVTVYEAADRIGGLLRYGIPDYKLPRELLDRRLRLLEAEGIEFVTGAPIGAPGTSTPAADAATQPVPGWQALRDDHDALLITIGARRPRDLPVPGRELSGVHFAMDFLERQNRINAGDSPTDGPDARDKHVIILGGGDTGADCLGTALRQGARSVRQLELMPQPPDERSPDNPWPQWPLVHRTASSHEEGGERGFAVLTKSLEGDADGRLTTLNAVRVQPTPPPADGAVPAGPPFEEVPDSEVRYQSDLLLLAMGFTGAEPDGLEDALGLELDARGCLPTDARYATSAPGVYAAGDAHRGQSLVVHAINEGREAAHAIDQDLRPTPLSTDKS